MVKSADSKELSRYGYAQELLRSMGGFSNFAISFSIISILTGAVTLYGYGLEMGGPLQMTLGWPLATMFTLTLACSMAELCSAFPTSGAMYHWAAALGGPGVGWTVGCLNIIGLIAAQAAINYGCAQFLLPLLGLPVTNLNTFLLFVLTLIVQGLLNHFGVNVVAWLNNASVVVHIVGVAIIVACVFLFAPTQPASFLFTGVNSNGRSPYFWAFLLGFLQAQWTFTGFDASAHMAEETADPKRTAPWGIVLSVAIAGIAGYALLVALTLCIRSIPEALNAHDAAGAAVPPAMAILQGGLGTRAGNAIGALVSMAMWFCGLSCITSTSRAIYSLARDNGTPWASFLSRVHPTHQTPGAAIWVTVGASVAMMAWAGAIPVVTSLSTIALYIAYVTPVWLGFRARRGPGDWVEDAVWTLGKWGPAVNVVATVYSAVIAVILVMPPNQLAGQTLGGLLLILALLWFSRMRSRFTGPEWARSPEEAFRR